MAAEQCTTSGHIGTSFCPSYMTGRRITYTTKQMKVRHPSKWVHTFTVSLCHWRREAIAKVNETKFIR